MTDPRAARDPGSVVDLRTDAMSPPTDEMWGAMRRAELGWALRGEDRSVSRLEALGAELLGKEAALLVPTCSMANLLALMTLGDRGTQIVLEATSHIVWSEEWGMAYVCGLFPRLLQGTFGVLDPAALEEAIASPQFSHLPRTSLVCLENSHNNAGGIAVTSEQTSAAAAVAHRHGAAVHLDGARLFNSAAALAIPARLLTEAVDTVAISLNKGLSAPQGALLCGTQRVIDKARINARRLGAASIHKAGIFAAAGIVALTTMVDRLSDDNRRAAHLAERLSKLPNVYVDLERVHTNIVVADVGPAGESANDFVAQLERFGVLALARSASRIRFVTHRQIGDAEVERTVTLVMEALGSRPSPV